MEQPGMTTTAGALRRPEQPVSAFTAVLAHLDRELHDDASLCVGGARIRPDPEGACADISRQHTALCGGQAWLCRGTASDLAAVLDACHAAAGGAAAERETGARVMAEAVAVLRAGGMGGAGIAVNTMLVHPNPDGGVVVLAAEDTVSFGRGVVAQLAGALRAMAGVRDDRRDALSPHDARPLPEQAIA